MWNTYDSWERLVAATLKREQFRRLAFAHSRESSISSIQSDFTIDSPLHFDLQPSGVPRNTRDSVLGDSSYLSGSIVSGSLAEADKPLSLNVKFITYKELKKATENFQSDLRLGSGYAYVYKGWINEHTLTAAKPGNGIPVAVKKLKPISYDNRSDLMLRLQKRIHYLGQFSHPNLVKFIGYCFEDDCLFLVHEFMQKGSLDNHLFRGDHQTLSWTSRINIALGAAKGICYMHEKKIQVSHQDFTLSSILLDGNFNSKLRVFDVKWDDTIGDRTQICDPVFVACGYCAPEFIATGHLSAKNDVYCIGVILLELLTGRCSIAKTRSSLNVNFVTWVKTYLNDERKFSRIMDVKLKGQYPLKGAYAACTVALQCVSPKRDLRPHMKEVVAILEQL